MKTDNAYNEACAALSGQVSPEELIDIGASLIAMAIDQASIEVGAWGLTNIEATILAKLDAVIKGEVPVPAVGLGGIQHCDRTEPMMTDFIRQKLKLVN